MSTITLSHSSQGQHQTCTSCNTNVQALADAQAHIEELEAQVRILTLRATSAVEKATEYETSLRRLNSTKSQNAADSSNNITSNINNNNNSNNNTNRLSVEAPRPPSIITAASPPRAPVAARLARLLQTRTASAPPQATSPYPAPPLQSSSLEPPYDHLSSSLNSPSPSEMELISALTHEQELRKAAENAVSKTESEIEELTGQLFEQANEMVASERKARAKLEERVSILEKRDGEKGKMLSLLEQRVQRVERVRALLKQESTT